MALSSSLDLETNIVLGDSVGNSQQENHWVHYIPQTPAQIQAMKQVMNIHILSGDNRVLEHQPGLQSHQGHWPTHSRQQQSSTWSSFKDVKFIR